MDAQTAPEGLQALVQRQDSLAVERGILDVGLVKRQLRQLQIVAMLHDSHHMNTTICMLLDLVDLATRCCKLAKLESYQEKCSQYKQDETNRIPIYETES